MRREERESTLDRINRLAEERLQLYIKASHSTMTESERRRVAEITRELNELWDQLRRERAARRARPVALHAEPVLEEVANARRANVRTIGSLESPASVREEAA